MKRTGFRPYVMKPCEPCGGERPHTPSGTCVSCYQRAKATTPGRSLLRQAQALRSYKARGWSRKTAEERFQLATKPGPAPDYRPELGPCLIYTGADNGNGYGQFRYEDRNGYAHRYAWERENGPIPKGLTVDHLCRVRRCCNTAHMELVDAVTNYRRGAAAWTTCPNGHPYDDATPSRRGHRQCDICRKETAKRGWEKKARIANGLPDRRLAHDQTLIRDVIAEIRAARLTVAVGAREIGCNPNYLGRRVWEETKRDVRSRDSERCARCGSDAGPLDVHHRMARGMGGASRPDIAFGMANLVTLCRRCHQHTEDRPLESIRSGLKILRSSATDPASIPVRLHVGWVLLANDGSIAPATPEVEET